MVKLSSFFIEGVQNGPSQDVPLWQWRPGGLSKNSYLSLKQFKFGALPIMSYCQKQLFMTYQQGRANF